MTDLFKEYTDAPACKECGYAMFPWKEGEHPDHGITPRIRCNACRRWEWVIK